MTVACRLSIIIDGPPFIISNEFHYIPRIESLIKAILIALRDSLARFLFMYMEIRMHIKPLYFRLLLKVTKKGK